MAKARFYSFAGKFLEQHVNRPSCGINITPFMLKLCKQRHIKLCS